MTVQTRLQQRSTPTFLGRVLLANAGFSGISGLALTFGARPIGAFLGVEAPFMLIIIGLSLLLYAGGLFYGVRSDSLGRQFARLAIGLDAAWVIGSIIILMTGWLSLTSGGKWAVAGVADIVAIFALLQLYGLRRKGVEI